jgi:hypothetical protein
MVKKNFSYIQRWLVILLALIALSLMSHYIADVAQVSLGACWSCRIQAPEASHPSNADSAHAPDDIHRGVLPSERLTFGLPQMLLTLGDMITPLGLAWISPTPVRPPITF